MSDVSQGPGWWQASDLKWYPPELHPDYVAPLPPPPTPPPPAELPPPPMPVASKGPSGRRIAVFVAVALAVIWVAGMAAIVLFTHGQLHRSIFHDGPSQSPGSPLSSPSSPSSAPSTSSPSYQQGLKSGTDGYAEVQAFGPYMGVALPYDQACQLSFNIDQGADPDLVQQDYIQGCLYGLNHQSAQWTQTRKTS